MNIILFLLSETEVQELKHLTDLTALNAGHCACSFRLRV